MWLKIQCKSGSFALFNTRNIEDIQRTDSPNVCRVSLISGRGFDVRADFESLSRMLSAETVQAPQ